MRLLRGPLGQTLLPLPRTLLPLAVTQRQCARPCLLCLCLAFSSGTRQHVVRSGWGPRWGQSRGWRGWRRWWALVLHGMVRVVVLPVVGVGVRRCMYWGTVIRSLIRH